MSDERIATCSVRMHEHCYFIPSDERRFDYCDNAIDAKCCPKGFVSDAVLRSAP
jgi:hypothetical protein